MPDPKDPYEGIPEFDPDPEHVDDDSEELPNPPDPKTGKRE